MSRRILCYGDSNTYGYDPRSCLGGRYPKTVRWTGLLEKAGWDVVNMGENGRAIPRLEWEMTGVVEALYRTEAETLAVMLGTNDLLQRPGLAAEVCGKRMKAFLTVLLRETPDSLDILLVSPPPVELGAWTMDIRVIEESRRLPGCYQELAEDMKIHFEDAGTWGVERTFDGVHFSERGHKTFGECMDKALQGFLTS